MNLFYVNTFPAPFLEFDPENKKFVLCGILAQSLCELGGNGQSVPVILPDKVFWLLPKHSLIGLSCQNRAKEKHSESHSADL